MPNWDRTIRLFMKEAERARKARDARRLHEIANTLQHLGAYNHASNVRHMAKEISDREASFR